MKRALQPWQRAVLIALPLAGLGIALASTPARSLGAPALDDPTEVLDASNLAALEAHVDQEVIVKGVVTRAAWAKSGKVCTLSFSNDDKGLSVIIFEKMKDKFDEAFAGDLAKVVSGATIRVHGKLTRYSAKDSGEPGKLEIVMSQTAQLTIIATAATSPAP